MLSKLFIHGKIKNVVSKHHKTCMQFQNMKLSKSWHLKYLLETKQFPAVTTEVSKVRVSLSSCTNHLCLYSTGWGATLPGALWHQLPHKASPEATTTGCRKMLLWELPAGASVSWAPLPSCAAASSTPHSLTPSGASAQLCGCPWGQLQPCQLWQSRRQKGTANSLPRKNNGTAGLRALKQFSLHSGAL